MVNVKRGFSGVKYSLPFLVIVLPVNLSVISGSTKEFIKLSVCQWNFEECSVESDTHQLKCCFDLHLGLVE